MNPILAQLAAGDSGIAETLKRIRLEKAVIKRLLAMRSDPVSVSKSEYESDTFNMVWFRENYPGFPAAFSCTTVLFKDRRVLHGFAKQPIVREYLKALAEHTDERVALCCRADGTSLLYVLHNMWGLELCPGASRYYHKGSSSEDGLIIESMPSFVFALQRASLW